MFQQFTDSRGILSCCHPEQHDAVRCDVILCLHLQRYQLVPRKFQISHTGKRQLLDEVVAAPFATHHVAQHEGSVRLVEQRPPIEHGLQRQPSGYGERGARQQDIFPQTHLVVQLDAVVGMIDEAGMHAGTPCGKVPVVLTAEVSPRLVVHIPLVAHVAVLQVVAYRLMVRQHRMEVVVVPVGTDADVEVADVEVQQLHLHGMLVEGHAVDSVAIFVEVDIVAGEGIRHTRLEDAAGVYRPVQLRLHALAQTEGQLGIHGHLGTDGHLGIGLQGHHLLAVEACPDVDGLVLLLTFHIFHLRTCLRALVLRTPVPPYLRQSQPFPHLHNLVPVSHSRLLAPAYQCIDSSLREARRAVALGVHQDMDIGKGQILLIFVLTVMIHNLQQDGRRRVQFRRPLQLALHVHADNDVGPHLSRYVSREVVRQATVHQHPVARPHR